MCYVSEKGVIGQTVKPAQSDKKSQVQPESAERTGGSLKCFCGVYFWLSLGWYDHVDRLPFNKDIIFYDQALAKLESTFFRVNLRSQILISDLGQNNNKNKQHTQNIVLKYSLREWVHFSELADIRDRLHEVLVIGFGLCVKSRIYNCDILRLKIIV